MTSGAIILLSHDEMNMLVQSLAAIMEATKMALERDPNDSGAKEEYEIAKNLFTKVMVKAINHSNESNNEITFPMEGNPELN